MLLLLLAACSPGAPAETSNAAANGAAANTSASATVIQPAGAPAPGPQDVIGATPGPCGSVRGEAWLGRAWSPQIGAELRQATGASEVTVRTGENPYLPPDDRRLNVYLNDSNRIILLDCG